MREGRELNSTIVHWAPSRCLARVRNGIRPNPFCQEANLAVGKMTVCLDNHGRAVPTVSGQHQGGGDRLSRRVKLWEGFMEDMMPITGFWRMNRSLPTDRVRPGRGHSWHQWVSLVSLAQVGWGTKLASGRKGKERGLQQVPGAR